VPYLQPPLQLSRWIIANYIEWLRTNDKGQPRQNASIHGNKLQPLADVSGSSRTLRYQLLVLQLSGRIVLPEHCWVRAAHQCDDALYV